MRIHVLVENTSSRADLVAEHGLSLLIEACGQRILFDMGASGAFADNAVRMGLSLSDVDVAVLSHGYYDHGGGLKKFLEINETAPVWMNPCAFEPHFNGLEKDIGLDLSLQNNERIRYAVDGQEIGPGMTLFSQIRCPHGIRPFGLTMGKGVPEDFRHEQYLLVEEGGKRILFSGCSHRGILNIVEHFRPDVLIGGFHFMKMDPSGPELEAAAAALKRYPCIYYTGHCTGEAQFNALKAHLGQQLRPLSSGVEIII